MGESDRYIDYNKRRTGFSPTGSPLVTLVCINAVVFVALFFIEILGHVIRQPDNFFQTDIAPWFNLPADLSTLASRPWTAFTYMFTHTNFIMMLTNMLWLWAFGSIFQNLKGDRRLIPVYIYGGLAGMIAFIASFYTIPAFRPYTDLSVMNGANAATMAVAIATTALAPDYRFFRMIGGGIPLWILTLFYVVIDFASIAKGGGAYNIAHVAGALTGFCFVLCLRKGWDWSAWMVNLYDWAINLFNPNKPKIVQNRFKEKVFYKTNNQKPYVKTTNITQQRVDEILDKINMKGYHLLTEEEKNILKRASDDL